MAEDIRKDALIAAKVLRRYPDVLKRHATRALNQAGIAWRNEMFKRFRAPLPQPDRYTNLTLHTRTGRLKGSLSVQLTGNMLADTKLTLASRGVPYAGVQEFGGTIRPRTRKYLTIPTKAAMTPAGVTRKSAAAWFREAKGEVYVAQTKSGQLAIFLHPTSAKGKPTALFLLRKRVTIPGPTTDGRPSRLGFFDTWARLQPRRRELFESALGKAVEEANRAGRG